MQQLQIPPLEEGEIYIGAIGDKNGDFYHVILLPGDNGYAPWQEQMDWAKSIGGDLPNRIEQAMLWANHKDQFEQDWYWSNETYHRNDAYAWYQGFGIGGQSYYGHKDDDRCRARAVRRLPI
ncbi:DUF1566 domain-containing protein [Paraburkholderia acidisoli]|uniref:DUF1566 domain-containing protein n=1 Tax=Paraburkholderia acidisoli TaxID=2571748 RepID=A0A7Z2GR21_9BURK|nr:DUF1566 domain-containing protein [Paraburkholderia acidisoli]QGZ66315.1 DUF1566 domain-containing protein [Paraburkholderia acidisoli]QGZ66400.1 DUF1566 domain-containing protein [Paraburkholderia acidisoli]